MQHDSRLHVVPEPARLHPRRVLELEIYARHIDLVLASSTDALPFTAARALVRRFEACDAASLRRGTNDLTLSMLGVTARTDGGEYALLRNWQNAAFAKVWEAQQ